MQVRTVTGSNRETGHAHGIDHAAVADAFARRVDERRVPGLESLILFGSTARGNPSGLESDVDFLAIVSDAADRAAVAETLRDIAYELMLEYGPVVEVHVLSRSQFDRYEATDHPFLRRVLREGKAYV